ncbi:hypothetical protein [Duganella callida]|uniref:Uncharacterized protein n=1 Tax=Duganella callida TaxID=2561932 RepID=A0A4Y9S7H8_9BURK|nr:hypothetical protein [Duganella callida]TFW16449.1 hypothetical protein E4L98_23325 [Duganella callida]
MDDKQTLWSLIMRFSYSLIVLAVYAAGAVLVELMARGMRPLGVSDFTYYMVSGTAHVMLTIDLALLIYLVYRSAKKWMRLA